ncbi:Tn7 transposase TnsA N-terminal domain-containing protein [Celeribacter sp. PS-C1]|uniref:Tn7 transposase TnsA N-terminal domain-containing protein n=2 Tax=unclassified Celeribacter TaxID=2618893 RepID=UPI002106F81A|nr:Tn7 transposase TnsA N-terminal domain-containing protein [Celeribacter sp. PS-C1]
MEMLCRIQMYHSNAYLEPLRSRATRNVMKPSRASSRGFLPLTLPKDGRLRTIFYESILEKRFLMLMAVSGDLFDIWEQPTEIRYRKPNGRIGHHIFDFLITLMSGERIAVAIKPLERVWQRNFERELECIASHMPKTFADSLMLITDRDLDVQAANAAGRDLMMRNRSLMGVAA